jgi:RimJ/RimL family protein N-acetyltransferase
LIVTDDQDYLGNWLCSRTGFIPTKRLMCIGRTDSQGKLMGVVGYDGFNGASAEMHCAGEGNWLSRKMLYAVFDYPFRVCGLEVVLIQVASGNVESLKLVTHVGFKVEAIINGAHPDGALWILSMNRKECRFFKETSNGQEISGTPSSA